MEAARNPALISNPPLEPAGGGGAPITLPGASGAVSELLNPPLEPVGARLELENPPLESRASSRPSTALRNPPLEPVGEEQQGSYPTPGASGAISELLNPPLEPVGARLESRASSRPGAALSNPPLEPVGGEQQGSYPTPGGLRPASTLPPSVKTQKRQK